MPAYKDEKQGTYYVSFYSDVTPEFLEELHFMSTILSGMKEEYYRNVTD